MSLNELYRQQYPWRPWDQIYRLLGDLTGQVVLEWKGESPCPAAACCDSRAERADAICVNQRAKVRIVKPAHSTWTRTFFAPFSPPSGEGVFTILQIEQRAPESPRAEPSSHRQARYQPGLERRAHPAHPHRPNPQPRCPLPRRPRHEKTPEC